MIVSICPDDLGTVRNAGTVIVVTGTDTASGDRITFAGDAAPMSVLLDAVTDGETVNAAVQGWAVMDREDDDNPEPRREVA